MSKREDQKRETKKQIITSAITEFMTKDYDQVKLSDISKAASIAEGTLYNYYPDKTSLFLDVFSNMVTLEKEPILEAHPNTFEELLETIDSILSFYLELKNPHMKTLFQTFYHKVKERQLREDFSAYEKLEDLSQYVYTGLESSLNRLFKKELAKELFPLIKYQINGLHEDYVYNLLSFQDFLGLVRRHMTLILQPYYKKTSQM